MYSINRFILLSCSFLPYVIGTVGFKVPLFKFGSVRFVLKVLGHGSRQEPAETEFRSAIKIRFLHSICHTFREFQ